MDITPRTYEQMSLCRTRYEVALIINGKSRIVGYTARRTRKVLLDYVMQCREEILPHINDPESVHLSPRADAIHIDDVAVVKFTGRTERDARQSIEAVTEVAR